MGCLRKLHSPPVECRVADDPARAIKGMHPLRQIVKILAVPVPLRTLVKGLIRSPFVLLFADPQSPERGMFPALLLIKAADPTLACVIPAMLPQRRMHLVNEK